MSAENRGEQAESRMRKYATRAPAQIPRESDRRPARAPWVEDAAQRLLEGVGPGVIFKAKPDREELARDHDAKTDRNLRGVVKSK